MFPLYTVATIAYGINSNVDVVIVADMHKSSTYRTYYAEPGENGQMIVHGSNVRRTRFLSVNEYQNYIGRAGRYGRSTQGFAYALMTQSPGDPPIRKKWDNLCRLRRTPPTAQSVLLKMDANCNRLESCPYAPEHCGHCTLQADELAMPILSLIPPEGITLAQIKEKLSHLPGIVENPNWLDRNLDAALKRLIFGTRLNSQSEGWVRYKRNEFDRSEARYELTRSGQIMSGIVLTMFEAKTMMRFLQGRQQFPSVKNGQKGPHRILSPQKLRRLVEQNPFDLFFQLCYLPELQKIAFDFFEIANAATPEGYRKKQVYQNLCTQKLRGYKRAAISGDLYNRLMHHGMQGETYNYYHKLPTLYRTLLAILIYEWYRSASLNQLSLELEANANQVTITPGRITRLNQQVSFYLQLTKALCQTFSPADEEEYEAYSSIEETLNRMEMCLYFGIRERDAAVIDTTRLRRLTRQQQMQVAKILDFCSNYSGGDHLETLTRRQRNDWRKILQLLHALPEESDIADLLQDQYPILYKAETLFQKG